MGKRDVLDVVNKFVYFCYAVNDVNLEIKLRITLANNSCYYYSRSRYLSSRDLSRTMKLLAYKSLMLSYGTKAWTRLRSNAVDLVVFERKVVKRHYDLLNGTNKVQRISI